MSATVTLFQQGQPLTSNLSNVSLLEDPDESQVGQQIANWGRTPAIANQQQEDTVGRCDALLYAIACITNIGLIVFGSLAIAEKMDSSITGWTIAALTSVQLISMIAKFMVSSEERRTGANCASHIGCPLVLSAAPIVCGILTGLGNLSGFTTGCVTVGTMSGLAAIVCIVMFVVLCSGAQKSASPAYGQNQQITQQAIRADQYV